MKASIAPVQIPRKDLRGQTYPLIDIRRVVNLASYSWIEAWAPTIAIPGAPPRWSPPLHPPPLEKVSGLAFLAQNAAHHPQTPLEPLFRSLYVTNPKFDVRLAHVITDSGNILNLLRFVFSGSSQDELESFSFRAEVIDNTVVFSQTEIKTTNVTAPDRLRDYDYRLKKTYTQPQLEDSTDHYRIIGYNFAGLGFIVRHKVDSYVPQPTDATSEHKTSEAPCEARTFTLPESRMTIRKEGTILPVDSALEIKTCTSSEPLDFDGVAAELWVSQTRNLVIAHHESGVVGELNVKNVKHDVETWEDENREALWHLGQLITDIRQAVAHCGGKALVEYEYGSKFISVLPTAEASRLVPRDLYFKWSHLKYPDGTFNIF
ncbi:hypothetical protein ANO14919_098670 [Xylariales sp. No.14919]|nr:hypothetical protein ANO14919_098670 [Xylariales sp. No.14919]